MRYDPSSKVAEEGAKSSAIEGPLVLPGAYTITLAASGASIERQVKIEKDPRVTTPDADLVEQLGLMLEVRDSVTRVHGCIDRIRSIRRQVLEWSERANAAGKGRPIAESVEGLKDGLESIELELIQTAATADEGMDRIALPSGVGFKIKELMAAVSSADAAPTTQQREVFGELSARAADASDRLNRLVEEDLQRFVDTLHEIEVPAILAGG